MSCNWRAMFVKCLRNSSIVLFAVSHWQFANISVLTESLFFLHWFIVLSQGWVLVTNDDHLFSVHRGIFRLLAEFQLENKDNPSYTGKTHSVLNVLISCQKKKITIFPNEPYIFPFSLLTGFSFHASVMICVQVCLFKIFTSGVVRPFW